MRTDKFGNIGLSSSVLGIGCAAIMGRMKRKDPRAKTELESAQAAIGIHWPALQERGAGGRAVKRPTATRK